MSIVLFDRVKTFAFVAVTCETVSLPPPPHTCGPLTTTLQLLPRASHLERSAWKKGKHENVWKPAAPQHGNRIMRAFPSLQLNPSPQVRHLLLEASLALFVRFIAFLGRSLDCRLALDNALALGQDIGPILEDRKGDIFASTVANQIMSLLREKADLSRAQPTNLTHRRQRRT